ncbi:MAG: histidine ammonia-lyase [Thermoplasmatota archaeon]
MEQTITLDGGSLTPEQVVSVARRGAQVRVAEEAWERVAVSRQVVDDLVASGEVAYGITTGFGEFAHVTIQPDQVRDLQKNLIMSHSVGVGQPLPDEVVRAMQLIRINTLVKGVSGVRRELVERLVLFLNEGIVPVVPSRGSVGASGDLAPLAHMALPVIGLGRVRMAGGKEVPALEAHGSLGVEPLQLEAKEGLALINGTQLMSGIGALVVCDAEALLADAQIAAAMSLEALMGSVAPFAPEVHAARPHPGQAAVAANLRLLTEGSSILHSHEDCGRVQDAYSIRCLPQVLGACRDVVAQARRVVEVEINSATDNPLVFPDGRIISQGNFHGEPIAFQLDFLAVALAEIGSMSERRIERLVNPDLSEGLKPFLVEAGGLNSGFMIAQYVAAALVSENKVHAHPATVDSIPTSAGQEDHVSMGSVAALKLAQVLENVRNVVAIEALCATQALDFKQDEGLEAGVGSQAAHDRVRADVPRLDADRILADDVEALAALLQEGALRQAVAAAGVTLA